MGLSSHQSAKMGTDEWLTPRWILNPLGAFALDPCSPPPERRPWSTAAVHFHELGLMQPWIGRVWLNPPFGREAVKWLAKLRDHSNGIALIPARTETKMFFSTVWGHADGILFLKGRPHFCYTNGVEAPFNSGVPICLVAYGIENAACLETCGLPGYYIRLTMEREG